MSSCYRCSTGCQAEAQGEEGCQADSFLYQDACQRWCNISPNSSGGSARSSPSHSLSPSHDPGQTQQGILEAHNSYRTGAKYTGTNKGQPLRWDTGLEARAKAWASELVDRCGETDLLDGGVPGRNVTKVTGATDAFYYSWPQVVDSWIYEGCLGSFWDASFPEQERSYTHFMTASFRDQEAIGCAQAFTSSCKATGNSLQAYVCQYSSSTTPAAQRGLYPQNPASQPLCAKGKPFPVKVE